MRAQGENFSSSNPKPRAPFAVALTRVIWRLIACLSFAAAHVTPSAGTLNHLAGQFPSPPYLLTFGPGPTATKAGFFLNNQRINPVILRRNLPAPSIEELTQYKAEGFNVLLVRLQPDHAANPEVALYLDRCRANGMPVIVEYATDIWGGWLQGRPSRNLQLSPDYPGGEKYVRYYPDFANPEVRDHVRNEVRSLVSSLRPYHGRPIIAYSDGAYDEYHLPDGETHSHFNVYHPHPLGEGNQTWVPYGPRTADDFRHYLSSRDIDPAALGFHSLSEVFAPSDKFTSRNSEHWRYWLLYRRHYVAGYIEFVNAALRSLSSLPVTGTIDLNFSLNENFAAPFVDIADFYDFYIFYYYRYGKLPASQSIPAQLETVRWEAARRRKPVISLLEFSSQIGPRPISIGDYLSYSLPYVSGFAFFPDKTLGENVFAGIVQGYSKTRSWDIGPPKADAAVFLWPLDVNHWDQAVTFGQVLRRQGCAYDVIYDYREFGKYRKLYIPPNQPAFGSNSAGQMAVKSFVKGGGVVLRSPF